MILLVGLFALAAVPGLAQTAVGDARNTDIRDTNTHFAAPKFGSRAEWESRRAVLRKQILFAAGLYPMPPKAALRAEVFGRVEHKEYSIEKVLLETLPGYWLGGNLYRPLGKPGRHPAILNPHGHWLYGRLENQPLESTPVRCINLARQGYVVLAYDMVGYNDTVQTPHSFGGRIEQLWGFGPLGLQLWNSIRALDFLETLPDVDASRMGATGASGGGTQTFLLAAVDDRVAFSAPVNMVSAIMQGGSPCENAPGLRVATNNVEIAAMMAPRPMLLVAATGDWTRNVPREEFPAIREIYALYDRSPLVEAVQFDSPHNYHKESREAVYRFFARHVLKAPEPESYREKDARVEKLADMLALHGRALPAGALDYAGLFRQWREMAGMQNANSTAAEKLDRLKLAIGSHWPEKVNRTRTGERILLSREGKGDRVPALYFEGTGAAAIVVHPKGSDAARGLPDVARLLADRRPVLLLDVFQTGAAVEKRNTNVPHYSAFNRPDDANRVQDILTAWSWIEAHAGPGGKPVELIGEGDGAIWATFAAALSGRPVRLRAPAASFAGTDGELTERFFVPGLQRAGGWRAALSLVQQP